MRSIFVGIILASGAALVTFVKASPQQPSPSATPENAHVVSTFSFDVAAPIAKVAPLFAPEAERSWAGEHWNPVFAHPQPGRDIEGAVFTVKHGPFNSVWVNTVFNIESGRMQYVAVVADKFAMTVDVQVTAMDPDHARVKVTYTRTALDPLLNEDVKSMAKDDKASGPDWQHGIESALGLERKSNP
ncbi:MAG TPA: hypothetical protein VMP12_10530 [Candidatus Sulfotelmatobacter sp.]|nr:hypothetical protein [Candidatus Sulfotelmatobacter sp.]